jgi:hypothetical protein
VEFLWVEARRVILRRHAGRRRVATILVAMRSVGIVFR